MLRIEDSGDNTKCFYLCDVSVYLKSCWRLRTSGWRAAPTNKLLCAVLEIDLQIPAQSRDLTRQDKSAIQVLFTEIIGHQQRGGFDEDKTVTKIIFCPLNSPDNPPYKSFSVFYSAAVGLFIGRKYKSPFSSEVLCLCVSGNQKRAACT